MNGRRAAVALAVTGLLVVAFAAGVVVAANGAKSWINPDVGLTAEEVRAAHEANSAAFWDRYAAWIAEINSGGRDPRSYPVTEGLATADDPPSTLSEAVRRAELIVAGEVTGVEFRPSADTVVRVRVSDVARGSAGASVDVVLPVALMPQDDKTWSPAIVAMDAYPMLYAGERVVLFLSTEPATGGLVTPQPWTGVYRVQNGRARAIPGSRLAPIVDGMTMEALLEEVKALD